MGGHEQPRAGPTSKALLGAAPGIGACVLLARKLKGLATPAAGE